MKGQKGIQGGRETGKEEGGKGGKRERRRGDSRRNEISKYFN